MDALTILKQKSRPVYTVSINQSIDDAIHLMAAKNVGVLIATDGGQPVGIFGERDVFRHYQLNRQGAFADIKIKSAMSAKLISAEPTDEITDLITVMIKSDLEHLPVVEDNHILGLLALRDLLEFQLESLTAEIHQLREYIDDLHAAGQD